VDIDNIMDIANEAVEGIFGRPISHVQDGSTFSYEADFQESADVTRLGLSVDASATMPALDVRTSKLIELELVPSERDQVTFDVHGEERTYLVAYVRQTAPGSTLLLLKERT